MTLLFLLSLGIILVGGLLAFLAYPHSRISSWLGCGGILVGSLLGLIPTFLAIRSSSPLIDISLGPLPLGMVALRLDALSAWFLLPLFLLAPLTAFYGREYLASRLSPLRLGVYALCFHLFLFSMMLVLVARDSLLFLVGWEGMTVVSYLLVVTEDRKRTVREAGLLYLVLSHLGVMALVAMFLLLGGGEGKTDLSRMGVAAGTPQAHAIFLLALLGFGMKAGFVPLHVWLPEAHPAAPSPISALMSGIMIKIGIYGLLRILSFFSSVPLWWGYTMIVIGAIAGMVGILFAVAEKDMKRLLAYSSIENIGILALAMGMGLVGLATDLPPLATLGFAGAFLHVLNHAMMKSLLFFGIGAVQHATGTRALDTLGGLWKRMPQTGGAVLVGSLAIAGLPPLNGFIGEFLIYLGGLTGLSCFHHQTAKPLLSAFLVLTILALSWIGVLAAVAFVKLFGITFLGEARSEHATSAHEPGWAMRLPLRVLSLLCIAMGLGGPLLLAFLRAPLTSLLPSFASEIPSLLSEYRRILLWITLLSGGMILVGGILAWIRVRLLVSRPVRQSVTWDCGFAIPTPRMQYSGSSFVEPLTRLWHLLLRTRLRFQRPIGFFPRRSLFRIDYSDLFLKGFYRPLLEGMWQGANRFKFLQHGNTHLYVLYIAVTLIAFLIWKLG